MSFIKNLKIKTKLFTGFLIILILSSVTGIISSISINNINDRNKAAYKSDIAPLEALMQVEVAFANVRQTSRGFIVRIVSDPSQLEKQEERLQGLLNTMSTSVETYIQTLKDNGSNPEKIKNSENVKNLFESELKPMIVNMMEIAKFGDISETVALLDNTNNISNQIYEEIQAIYASTLNDMSNATQENSKAANKSSLLTFLLTIISFIACLILAIIVSNSIVKPIKRLLGITEDLIHGNLDINKMEITKDEVGVLASNFFAVIDILKSLIDGMKEMSKQHNEGNIDAKIQSNKFEGVFNDVVTGINDMVFSYVNSLKEVIHVLNNISEGQFEVSIQQYPGKKAALNAAINEISISLKGISEEIHKLAKAAGGGNLSQRGNSKKFKGDWADILEGLNILLENMVKPIQESSSVLYQIAHGNLEEKIIGDYKGDFAIIKNSVNGLSASISSYIKELSEVLTNLSNNNLNQEITREYTGDFVAIKSSINLIIKKLNSVMSELGSVSEQVSTGSRHISENSAILAQGAADQESSIVELAATIDILNQQTQQNALNAKTVNDLSKVSKENAAIANTEMNQMLLSMDGIKDSSNNISKIIKVIEDIAFQTSLLALNASVEAARAGEHGKGFTVVAEEVRNLSSRSQNAAKETNELILNSITKVDEGMKVATNTASSLVTIVNDFEQISVLINNITSSSNEQAATISEVSNGLGQISKVVQANTASSEESASASEELASQSEVLKAMINTFKLKNVF